jgi:uncharacterized protein (DUF58 family)
MQPDRGHRRFLDHGVLARLARFPLAARRPMQGTVAGIHASPHRGSSVEFAEYRKYVPGDDIRRLDWRAYGRTDRHFVKEFESDTNLRCCFVLDTSGSMDFGSKGETRLDYARRLAATLGYLAVQQGDAVGLTCVADGVVRNIPPRRNPSHLRSVFDALEHIRPEGPSRLVPTLHELAETIRSRALVVVLSDLFVPPDELGDAFQHLRFRHHDLAVFHLLDPQELRFDFRRPTRFLDMEGGAPLFADPVEIAHRYQKALRDYLDALTAAVRESAVDYHRLALDDDLEQALIRFLVGRARAGRAR